MRVRYHWIRGKRVRTVDGRCLGRVTDLVAEAKGDALCVTALLVGYGGFIRRIGFLHRRLLGRVRALEIPWRLVADLGDEIRLSVDRAELLTQCARKQDERANASKGAA
jgi:sporulation protein YlmC with PRC-barrel domain